MTTFFPRIEHSLTKLINDLEKSLEDITKCLKESGLIVNHDKTEICPFYKRDMYPVIVNVRLDGIAPRNQINVLEVLFDSKLQ
jgi:hypothetical protein